MSDPERYKSRGRKERTPEQLKVLELAREKARLVIAERTRIKREMEETEPEPNPPPEPEETEPPTPPPEPEPEPEPPAEPASPPEPPAEPSVPAELLRVSAPPPALIDPRRDTDLDPQHAQSTRAKIHPRGRYVRQNKIEPYSK